MKKLLIATAVLAIAATAPVLAADNMSTDAKATMMTKHFFPKMDTNGDGMVSKEEHDAAGTKMFAEADTNGDGNVSMDEMKAMKKKEIEEMMAEKGTTTSSSSTTTTKTMMKK